MNSEVMIAIGVVAVLAALAYAVVRMRGPKRPPPPPTAQAAPFIPAYAPVDPLSSFDNAAAPFLREEIFRGFARHQADKWWADMADAAGKLGPKPPVQPSPPAPPNA